jgi:hypothetical protein
MKLNEQQSELHLANFKFLITHARQQIHFIHNLFEQL